MIATKLEVVEIDLKNHVSSSDFKRENPKYFAQPISGGYKISGGHSITMFKYLTGIILLADSESWTVGYAHPNGYGKLYGAWYVPDLASQYASDIIVTLMPRIVEKETAYTAHERSLFPEWQNLSRDQKRSLRSSMEKSGHVPKRSSLATAGQEYAKFKTFWGQDVVQAKMTRSGF